MATEKELRKLVATWGNQYLGIKEGSADHKAILKIFNDSKLCTRYTMTVKDAWCQTFASAAGIANGLSDIIPVECSCNNAISLWKKLGRWKEDESYVPKQGDYIYYDWDDNGVGDNKGSSEHVGIVYGVSGSTITVIEGNYSNTVKKRTISVNGKYIRGYGLPNYASKATSESKPAADTKPSSSTSPEKIEVEYADKCEAGHAKGTILKVKTPLNMRTGAGTNKKIIKVLEQGAKLTWYGYYTKVGSVKWYLVIDSTGQAGFCSNVYLSV